MSARVGIELTPSHVRAVAYGRFGKAPNITFELPWDPSRPRDVVAVLGERLGRPGAVALAIGLGFLHVTLVKLPPAPQVERERMLALEPDRYFAAPDESLSTALSGDANIAFAIPTTLLASIVEAFEEWTNVERVEPSPVAIARVLGGTGKGTRGTSVNEAGVPRASGAQGAATNGLFAVPTIDGEVGLIELADGRLMAVRRLTSVPGVAAGRPLPTVDDLAPRFLAAAGAARGMDLGPDGMLATAELRESIRARRSRRTILAAAACAASLIFAIWAFDRSREQRLDTLRAEIVVAERKAAPALQADARLQALTREAATIRTLAATRPDPSAMLAAIGEVLPEGATVLSLRATGDEWQIDGTARNAAELVPLLDIDGRFDGVRFLTASSRFREGSRSYETFSIALRVKPKA